LKNALQIFKNPAAARQQTRGKYFYMEILNLTRMCMVLTSWDYRQLIGLQKSGGDTSLVITQKFYMKFL
jgi:hypothetical protein